MMKIVHVGYTLKPGKLDAYRKLFEEFKPRWASIEGMSIVGPAVALDNPDTVFAAVVYESDEAYDAAYGAEAFKEYGARLVPLVAKWEVYMQYEAGEAKELKPLTE
jgi:quinol monooxygenase YgiN